MVFPFPHAEYLVPPLAPPDLSGFERIDQPILGGLPHVIALDRTLTLKFVVPTGWAKRWLELDAGTLVADGASIDRPHNGAAPPPPCAPLIVQLTTGKGLVASVPLTEGALILPNGGPTTDGVRVELAVLAFAIHAGTMRGPGDWGSSITLAWRVADKAVAEFSTPPPKPAVAQRLPPAFKSESHLGLKAWRFPARFVTRKALLTKVLR